jgi:hypothetical protein
MFGINKKLKSTKPVEKNTEPEKKTSNSSNKKAIPDLICKVRK